jgi:hypothetical protein
LIVTCVAGWQGEWDEKEEAAVILNPKTNKRALFLSFLAMVVVGFLNTVFQKLQSVPM